MARSPMVPSTRLWVGICGLLALGGCAEATVPRACQLVDPAPAVRVEVQDSVTLAWVASGATLVLQDGAFVDSVSVPASRTDLNAVPLFTSRVYGRPGTYVVTETQPAWMASKSVPSPLAHTASSPPIQ